MYQLDPSKQKEVGTKQSMGKSTNRCEICHKYYRYPCYIFEPRDRICATCERNLSIAYSFQKVMGTL
jgi:hypothetical protein